MAKTKPAKALEKANNYYIVLALITLLTVGVSAFAAKALIGSIVHSTKVLSAKSAANKQLDSDQSAAPQLITSYKALTPAATQILADALPNNADFPSFIAMMENIGGQAGVTLSSVAPDTTGSASTTTTSTPAASASGTATAPAGASSVTAPQEDGITFTVKGAYPAMQKFFTSVELSARPIRITSIQLTGNNSALTANISATTYYEGQATLPFSTRTIK